MYIWCQDVDQIADSLNFLLIYMVWLPVGSQKGSGGVGSLIKGRWLEIAAMKSGRQLIRRKVGRAKMSDHEGWRP